MLAKEKTLLSWFIHSVGLSNMFRYITIGILDTYENLRITVCPIIYNSIIKTNLIECIALLTFSNMLLHWYGHRMTRYEEPILRKWLKMDILGKRRRGRPKTIWKGACQRDLKSGLRASKETDMLMWGKECHYSYRCHGPGVGPSPVPEVVACSGQSKFRI